MGGMFGAIQTISAMDEQDLTYTDTNVQPFTVYQYRVEASNSAGSVISNYSSILSQEDGKTQSNA